MNPHEPHWDYGLSSFDIRHTLSMNATYDLPFGQRKGTGVHTFINALISQWQASVIASAQTGLPFSPQLGFNPTNDGNSRNPIRPSWNPAFSGNAILGNPNRYYDPNAFIVPLKGTYGNVGRDTLQGPGLSQVDLSFSKRIPLTERIHLQFRGELFNILNHTNFNAPNPIVFTSANSPASPTAGVITSTTTTSRQIQFGLKLQW